MSLGERFVEASDRLWLGLRHPQAWSAQLSDATGDFEGLLGHKYCLVETYRRSGEVVPTPVWFVVDRCRVYFRTQAEAGKVKRIRADPRIRVAPSTARGRPLGPAVEGRARLLSPAEGARAEAALRAHYGVGRKLYERLVQSLSSGGVYVEIVLPGD
jgi:PPOX class probable F420-dependent enzyme